MNGQNRNGQGRRVTIAVLCMASLLLLFRMPNSYGEAVVPSQSSEAKLRLGERMYREGILPSGEPMRAYVKGDLPVPGTAFTCISCHLRSGLGSVEGGVVTPPTNSSKLFQPLKAIYKGYDDSQKPFQKPFERPAYTDKTLAEMIRSGLDPTGRTLNDVMPRYLLENEEMDILVSYLKALSAQFSPGVSDATLHFATVITDEVSPEDRDAMLTPLENYINNKNNQAKSLKTQSTRSRAMAESMLNYKEVLYKKLSLSRWVLKGPPDTWRRQLEDYYRNEPVFALLGGITTGEWQPVHQFSEEHQIPCLFPVTDFPVVSKTDWYTLYLSKGYYQEGEGAARYLNGLEKLPKGGPIVQIVRDSREGRALAAGFLETWAELGRQGPVTVTLKADETITREFVQEVLAKEKPAAVILWAGAEALPALETFAVAQNRPETVFVSSSYLGKSMWTLQEQVRDFTYITYPFRLPQDEASFAGYIDRIMKSMKVQGDTRNVVSRIYAANQVLTLALMDMRGNYYRDNFLDVIGMMPDQTVPLYERLSFGPGQRYASKGCYIVQLGKGSKPELVKKSTWVIH